MGNKQVYFSFAVGALIAVLGGAISFVSQAGWSLSVVGCALVCFSVVVKLFNTVGKAEGQESDGYHSGLVEPIQAIQVEQSEEVRHAA